MARRVSIPNRCRRAAALIAIFAGVAVADSGQPLGAVAPTAGWRDADEFVAANRAITGWLEPETPDLVAEWRAAVNAAPRAASLGSELLRLAARRDATPAHDFHGAPPSVALSLRLAAAERAFFERRFDASLALLESREGDDDAAPVYAPELRSYLRAIGSLLTVETDSANAALTELPSDDATLRARLGAARRFVVQRARREIANAEAPLTAVARRMADAQRRLALGAAGEPTQRQQQRAIDALDELIRDLERQQQEQQAAAAGAGGGGGGQPADDSRPSEFKGPGEVDRRRFTQGDPWGALSPAERERLTQGIARDFPDHYRELIERYYESLANPADPPEEPTAP